MKQIERTAWVITVLAISAWSVLGKKEPETGKPDQVPLAARTGRAGDRMSPMGGTLSRTGQGTRTGERSSLQARSKQVLRSTDPLTRLSEFLNILETADAGDLEQVTATLAELKKSGLSLSTEEELLHFKAGQLKGAELLAGHQGSAEDFAIIGDLKNQYEGWIQANPQAAGTWLDGLPAGKFHDQMAISYIAACAKDDPVRSLALVSSLHPSQQEIAGRAAAEKLAGSASAEEASALFRTLESNAGSSDRRYISTMFDTLVSESGKTNFAASLVESNLSESFVSGSTLARVSQANAKTDPEAALQWAVSMEGKKSDVPEGEVVTAAIGGMTLEGLKSAKEWASTQGDGAAYWLNVVEKRRELLEEHQGEDNKYDRDD